MGRTPSSAPAPQGPAGAEPGGSAAGHGSRPTTGDIAVARVPIAAETDLRVDRVTVMAPDDTGFTFGVVIGPQDSS